MNRRLQLTSITLLVIALASSVFSQGTAIRSALRDYLERTDEIIEQAKAVQFSTDDPRVVVAVDAAVKLQATAWDRFYEATTGQDATIVKGLSSQAREWAYKAIASGRATEQNANSLLSQLEQMSELLAKVRESTSEGPVGNRHDGVLDAAQNALDRAWELYRDGHYRAALKVANQVETTLQKVMAVAQEANREQNQFERRSEFVQRGLDRVAEILSECNSEAAQQLYERAMEAHRRAQELHAEGRPLLALRSLQNARRMGAKAARECGGGHSLDNRYERLLTETDLLAEQVPTSDDAGQSLLQMVYEQLQMAAEYIEAGQTSSAAASLKAAELALGQLDRHLGPGEK